MVDGNEPEWIIEQTKARKRREMLRQREDMEARLKKIRAKEKAQRDRYLRGDQTFKKRKTDASKGTDEVDEDQFLLDDYDSDREQSTSGSTNGNLSAATLELLEKLGMNLAPKEEDVEDEDEIKVIYSPC